MKKLGSRLPSRSGALCAVAGERSVKSSEETTILIPRNDDGVVELLERLEADRAEVEETDIVELEAEIHDDVYDLFDLSVEERAVVEDYFEVFGEDRWLLLERSSIELTAMLRHY